MKFSRSTCSTVRSWNDSRSEMPSPTDLTVGRDVDISYRRRCLGTHPIRSLTTPETLLKCLKIARGYCNIRAPSKLEIRT